MLRGAIDANSTLDEVLNIMNRNFERGYRTNKAPFVLPLNADFMQMDGSGLGMAALERYEFVPAVRFYSSVPPYCPLVGACEGASN